MSRPDRLIAALGLLAAVSAPAIGDEDPFVEAALSSGLDFVHVNGMTGKHYLLEVMGSGVALVDYDRDGDLDVYLVQGGPIGESGGDSAEGKGPGEKPPGDRLFRNDPLADGDGGLRPSFHDVTAASGIQATGYGMGVAVGDYDGDGRPDLYVTNFGSNQLLRNRGDGTFQDLTAASGTDDPRWSVPAAFVDYDGDGFQDLWVGNYVDFRLGVPGFDHLCLSETGAPDYCGPLAYRPVSDRLFRNQGDGTFRDVTTAAGLAEEFGGALGVAAADFDGNGRSDLYVANDMTPNQLWLNQGDGGFRNEAILAGAAVNWEGKPEASMGVAVGDFDSDGDEDLFMTHLTRETNTLYVNDGNGFFTDETQDRGLAQASWSSTAFGTAWIDYDNDRDLDLVVVNGAVRKIESLVDAGDPYPLHQPNQLFENLGNGSFQEIPQTAASSLGLSEVSRGTAMGDVDNDGDPDLVISNNHGPARLLLNRLRGERPWLGLRLGEGEGAQVTLTTDGGQRLRRRAHSGGSYASAHDSRVLFGLGEGGSAERILVRWPGGRRQALVGLAPNRLYALTEPSDASIP